VFDSVLLVSFVAVVMAVGTIWPKAGLFKIVYQNILKGRVLAPDVVADNPQPHRFSQGFGAAVLGIALILFVAAAQVAAWIVVGVVVALAALNLFVGFCAGCYLYYQLAKANVAGFKAMPLGDGPLGMRPHETS
jgi:uncharacterized membrane protein HdeD (DUF308 family)